MIYEIFHETKFKYASIVTFSHNIARLQPCNLPSQEVLDFQLTITPTPYEQSTFVDFFNNINTHMLIRNPHEELVVTALSKVHRPKEIIQNEIEQLKAYKITLRELKERLQSNTYEDISAKQYLFESGLIPTPSLAIEEYIKKSFEDDKDVIEATLEFVERIFKDFKFVSGFSDVTTPIEHIFKEKKGVCQDFAQFAISALRSIGIPTRYMSGYIQTIPTPGKEKLFGADASHAWFAIYLPGFGWVQFDPTNNKIPNEEYIILGYGRDYLDITPLKGVVKSSGSSQLSVKVNVKEVKE